MSTAKRRRSCEKLCSPSEAGSKRPKTILTSGATSSTQLTRPNLRKRPAISSKAYSLLTEPSHRPHLPGLHPNMQALEARIPELCGELLRWFDEAWSNGYQHKLLQTYYQDILEARHPVARYPEQQPVCVIGDTGVGKSRLMGCLLACLKLATTAFDERGTNIPHEFRGVTPEQRKSEVMFLVTYSYLADNVLRKHVDDYVCTIFHYLAMVESKAKEAEAVDAEDMEEQRAACSSAIDDLLYLLYDSKTNHLDTKDHLMAWFETSFRDAPPTDGVTSTIMAKIESYKADLGITGMTTKTMKANTMKELESIYEKNSRPPPTTRRSKGERHPWALVEKVTVHFDHPYLNEGGILCDTPGLGDKNNIVAESTKRYLGEAGLLLVAALASRVQTTSNVDKFLNKGISLGKDMHLVTTHNDLKAGKHDKPGSGNSEQDLSTFEKLFEELEMREESLREVQESEEEVAEEGTSTPHYPGQVSPAIQSARYELSRAEDALQRHRVYMRSKVTSDRMRNRLRELDANGDHPDLLVTPTNVEEYEEYLAGRGEDAKLTLNETGIPTITRMLYKPISSAKYNTMHQICVKELPTAAQCIITTLSNNSLTEYQRIREEIEAIVEKARRKIPGRKRESLNAIFTSHIAATFRQHEGLHWPTQAEAAVDVWSAGPKDLKGNATMMHATNFKSFCHNRGQHQKLAIGKRARESLCWNRDLNDIMEADLEAPFNSAIAEVKQLREGPSKQDALPDNTIDLMVSQILSKFDDLSADDAPAAQTYMAGLKDTKKDLVDYETQLYTQCRKALDEIRKATIFSADESCYTGHAMEATYKAAAAVQGGTRDEDKYRAKNVPRKSRIAHEERVTMVRDRVCTRWTKYDQEQTNVFRDVGKLVHDAWTKHLDKHIAAYSKRLERGCEMILQQLDMYKPVPKKNAEHAAIEKKLLHEAQKFLRGLEECEVLLEGCNDWSDVK